MFENKTIYITGGTGSWGKRLTSFLLNEKVKEIKILSRNESLQVEMKRLFNDNRLKFFIGDVRDYKRVLETMKNSDYVFHLAAIKHVPICEEYPMEAIKTNIIGTNNVIEAAIENKVDKVIAVSSDKAVRAHNLYGLTKAVEEKLVLVSNKRHCCTKFVCIRAGNVMGSAGSVIPLFMNQLKNGKKVTLTSTDMTRFFITLEEAINLLIHAALMSKGGEIFVMKMPALRIIDLIDVLANELQKNYEIDYVGVRPGEKIFEELISPIEMLNTYSIDDNYYLIIPEMLKDNLMDYYKDYRKVNVESYTSNTNLLNKKEIKDKLKKGNFI